MTTFVPSPDLTANANAKNEHGSAAANADSAGAAEWSAGTEHASASGSGAYDAPELPEAPELPDLPEAPSAMRDVETPDVGGALDGVDATAGASGGAESEHGSAGFEGSFDGWLDAMRDAFESMADHVGSLFGL